MRRDLIRSRARALRKSMSEPEIMLWSRLRGRTPDQPTFSRQHPFGTIVLDFYCPSARLAVEVDGSTHWSEEERERDAGRDGWLRSQGVAVVRIEAGEVYRDLSAVVDGILRLAEELRAEAASHCQRPAPSTTRSAAGVLPPAASRGR
jgi:very-short-patch-repair endonuclease